MAVAAHPNQNVKDPCVRMLIASQGAEESDGLVLREVDEATLAIGCPILSLYYYKATEHYFETSACS